MGSTINIRQHEQSKDLHEQFHHQLRREEERVGSTINIRQHEQSKDLHEQFHHQLRQHAPGGGESGSYN